MELFHVAPSMVRESIRVSGLDGGRHGSRWAGSELGDVEPANYLYAHVENARWYAAGMLGAVAGGSSSIDAAPWGAGADLWRVDAEGLQLAIDVPPFWARDSFRALVELGLN